MMKVHQVLEMVSRGDLPDWWSDTVGLCNQDWAEFTSDFEDVVGDPSERDMAEVFYELWEDWDMYSGNIHYPVPYEHDPKQAYNDIEELYEGQYGANRMDLAGYLATQLRK